jgi:hypothetical protein
MQDRRLSHLAAEIHALALALHGVEIDPDKLDQEAHVANRLMDVAQTFADQAQRDAMSYRFPPIEED